MVLVLAEVEGFGARTLACGVHVPVGPPVPIPSQIECLRLSCRLFVSKLGRWHVRVEEELDLALVPFTSRHHQTVLEDLTTQSQ